MHTSDNNETIVELDELELLVVMDNETDTLSSVDEGLPQLPEAAITKATNAKRCSTSCVAVVTDYPCS